MEVICFDKKRALAVLALSAQVGFYFTDPFLLIYPTATLAGRIAGLHMLVVIFALALLTTSETRFPRFSRIVMGAGALYFAFLLFSLVNETFSFYFQYPAVWERLIPFFIPLTTIWAGYLLGEKNQTKNKKKRGK